MDFLWGIIDWILGFIPELYFGIIVGAIAGWLAGKFGWIGQIVGVILIVLSIQRRRPLTMDEHDPDFVPTPRKRPLLDLLSRLRNRK